MEIDTRNYGITIYNIFGSKKLIHLQKQEIGLLESSDSKQNSFIDFKSIVSIDTGILTEIWSYKEMEGDQYYNDGLGVGFNLFTLKRSDIIEIMKAQRNLVYYKVMYDGLHRISIDQSMIK